VAICKVDYTFSSQCSPPHLCLKETPDIILLTSSCGLDGKANTPYAPVDGSYHLCYATYRRARDTLHGGRSLSTASIWEVSNFPQSIHSDNALRCRPIRRRAYRSGRSRQGRRERKSRQVCPDREKDILPRSIIPGKDLTGSYSGACGARPKGHWLLPYENRTFLFCLDIALKHP